MNAEQIVVKAQEHFSRMGKKSGECTSLSGTGQEWVVSLEAVERKAIPDSFDVLGLYEIRMDFEGNLLGFSRKRLRKRSDTEPN